MLSKYLENTTNLTHSQNSQNSRTLRTLGLSELSETLNRLPSIMPAKWQIINGVKYPVEDYAPTPPEDGEEVYLPRSYWKAKAQKEGDAATIIQKYAQRWLWTAAWRLTQVPVDDADEDDIAEHLRNCGRGDLQIYVDEFTGSIEKCVKLLLEKYPVKRISKKQYKPADDDY